MYLFVVALVFVMANAVISIKDANQCMKWNCGVFIYLLTSSFVVGVVVIGGVVFIANRIISVISMLPFTKR